MKKLFYFLICLALSGNVLAQWTVLNSTTSNDLHDVEFLNEEYGIAVGDGGTILKTLDGGTTWTNLLFSGPDNFNGVALSGKDTIYAAGTGTFSPTVYRSTDAGVTWQKVLLDPSILSICTSSDADVFAAGDYIYHSQDAGETWTQPYTVSGTVTPFTIQDVDDQTVHMGANVAGIVTYSAIVVRTANGGSTFWDLDVFSFPNANALSAFSFTYPDTGYLFMNDYDVFNPNDSSQLIRVFNFHLVPALGNDSLWVFNYESINLLFGDYVNDCKFFKNHSGYAVGSKGNVYHSTDGGITWADDYTGTNELFALNMIDENAGYAVGALGTILKKGIGTQVSNGESHSLDLKLFPNPAHEKSILLLSSPEAETGTLTLLDVNGKVCFQMEGIHLSKGSNQFHLDLSNLAKGTYLMNVTTNNAILGKKLLVIL